MAGTAPPVAPDPVVGASGDGLRLLRAVLATKIVGTILLFCLPMIFLSQDGLEQLYGLRPEPLLTAKLIGGAYAALIVGYVAGWLEAGRGRFPGWVVAMGLVSNGGGAFFALLSLLTGDIDARSLQPFGFAAVGFAALIALGLTLCAVRRRRRP